MLQDANLKMYLDYYIQMGDERTVAQFQPFFYCNENFAFYTEEAVDPVTHQKIPGKPITDVLSAKSKLFSFVKLAVPCLN